MQVLPQAVRRLDRLFERQAASTPDALAVIDGDGSTTFAELDAMAARIAGTLREAGVRSQSVVGVHVDRSRDYVAAVLGVLKAGAAVVPLPPTYPFERLREILAFAGLAAVIDDAGGRLDTRLHSNILDVVQAAAPCARPAIPTETDPGHPAFILCSSGSTGVPKMIVRSHGSFFHRLEWTWRTHPFAPDEVCCQKAHMTTTHAVYELFEPLLRGIPVCIIADPQVRALESFWATIRQHAITRLLIVPSMLQASLDMPGFAAPDLRVLTLMGEAVHPPLAARVLAAFPPMTSIQSIYGSTEASSVLVCDLRSSFRDGHDVPLGDPISPDVHAYVLDENLDALADGAPGMLYLSGPALFSGYFRNEALTDATCVTRNGERFYRTNDRVVRTEGALHYLGRINHVVKSRGFRIEVQEVENALARHPGVGQCAVVAKHAGDGDAALVAFVTPETLQTSDVYRTLREVLPDYMLPSRIIPAATLPLTLSGKVDRRKLLEDCARQTPSPSRYASDTERRVAEAWQNALGHANFDRDSNFFEAGGSSLKTFSVIAQLRGAFALGHDELPDDAVYRFPTVRQLAACIDGSDSGGAAIEGESILVTLKAARDARAEPLFVIASAGGTLGAYEKVVRALATEREAIGVRDPFLWGKRDPASGFRHWVGIYLDAIRARQPDGPYHLLGYSSAGAFACEIARQLRSVGAEVALLALVDPLAMDRSSRWRFGYWALQARFERPAYERLLTATGWLRAGLRAWPERRQSTTEELTFTEQQFLEFRTRTLENPQHILQLSVLLELNTGLPLALTRQELDRLAPMEYLDALVARLRANVPDVDAGTIERLAVQYAMQVRAQHQYQLRRLGCPVVLFEPDGPHCGLLGAQLMPYASKLFAVRLPWTAPTGRIRELAACFSAPLQPHYLSMRDDTFAHNVAQQLDRLLDHQEPLLSRRTPE